MPKTAYDTPPAAPGQPPLKTTAPAVVRAVQVLDALSAAPAPVSLADLARATGAPKSSLHGLCETLVHLRLVKRLPDGTMALGPHVMGWANAFLSQTQITEEFRTLWEATEAFGEATVTLSMLDDTEVVYLACRNGNRPLGVTFRIGMRLPAPYTATGKAILSTLSPEVVRSLLVDRWPDPLTRASVASPDALAIELDTVRALGYSTDNGQMREGMTCFGAPVFDASGHHAVGAIAVSYLTNEIDAATAARVGPRVRDLADKLSARLGHRKLLKF
ncbi:MULTISPECIES: IclR family transcriptional regulator [Cupriavidus]|uniref:IclR family transcriptional regulator n=1 Tax=Cupriavidus pauculus TaxID=82633 RepID=A0A5P2HEE5_9BURK|nr:IclR family transcriptional regulator [Cupriavidus pauculus]QET05974.1 IclR family transcriptional regulator [Cupriavidus pauculus]